MSRFWAENEASQRNEKWIQSEFQAGHTHHDHGCHLFDWRKRERERDVRLDIREKQLLSINENWSQGIKKEKSSFTIIRCACEGKRMETFLFRVTIVYLSLQSSISLTLRFLLLQRRRSAFKFTSEITFCSRVTHKMETTVESDGNPFSLWCEERSKEFGRHRLYFQECFGWILDKNKRQRNLEILWNSEEAWKRKIGKEAWQKSPLYRQFLPQGFSWKSCQSCVWKRVLSLCLSICSCFEGRESVLLLSKIYSLSFILIVCHLPVGSLHETVSLSVYFPFPSCHPLFADTPHVTGITEN